MASRAANHVKPLLELDPELGDRLAHAEREHASRVKVGVQRLPPGHWDNGVASLDAPAGTSAGFVVVEGLIVRETEMAETWSAELLSPGDVVLEPSTDLLILPAEPSWRVLTRAQIGILDRRFIRAAGRTPGLAEALIARAAERTERLARQRAISQLPRVD